MPEGKSPEIVTSSTTLSRDSLPQKLPDQSHAPLVNPFDAPKAGESSLIKASSPDKSPWKRGVIGAEHKPFNPSDDEVAKQVEKMRQAELARVSVDKSKGVDSGQGLSDDLSRTALLTAVRIPESHKVVSTIENRRAQQSLPNFNELYNEREALFEVIGAAAPTPEQEAALRNIEARMEQVFESAVKFSGFSIDQTRDLTPQYIGELNRTIESLRGAGINDNQAESLKNYVENAVLSVAGESTDGFSWEFRLSPSVRIESVITSEPLEGSIFQQTEERLRRIGKLDASKPPRGIDRQAWEQAISARMQQENARIEVLIQEAEQAGVMDYVVDSMMSAYDLVQSQRFKARTRPDEPTAEDYAYNIPEKIRETFWESDDPQLFDQNGQPLSNRFAGIARYLASPLMRSVLSDLRNPEREIDFSDRGDVILEDLKERRETIRQRATSKERLVWNDYLSMYDFSWAENIDELRDTIFDWAEKFEETISGQSISSTTELVRQWKQGAERAFDSRVNSLGLNEKDPEVKRLRDMVETDVDVIGGCRYLEIGKDGFEGYVGNLESFMRESVRHMDAIVLSSQEVFIADDQISMDEGRIYLAGDEWTEKPKEEHTEQYRGERLHEARRYASTHEIYVTDDDFKKARLKDVIDRITAEVTARAAQQPGISQELIDKDIQRRIKAVEREEQRKGVYHNSRYGWGEDDPIQELLLQDQRGRDKAAALPTQDAQDQELQRVEARTGVFKDIKKRWDKKEQSILYPGKTLHDLTYDERKDETRKRIRAEIDKRGFTAFGAEIDQMGDAEARDKALWGWVKRINDNVNKYGTLESGGKAWFPTKWDFIRLSIDRPQKLRDRGLTKEQAEAMVQKIDDRYEGMTTDQIRSEMKRANDALPPDDRISERELKEKTEQELFRRAKKIGRATRSVDRLMKFHTFIGYEARAGGLQSREVESDPNSPHYGETKMIRIYDEFCDILTAKIKNEEEWIERQVEWYQQGIGENLEGKMAKPQKDSLLMRARSRMETDGVSKEDIALRMAAYTKGLEAYDKVHKALTKSKIKRAFRNGVTLYDAQNRPVRMSQDDVIRSMEAGMKFYDKARNPFTDDVVDKAVIDMRRYLRRDTTFALTHAAKEMGLSEGELPNWSPYYYGDEKLIDAMAPYFGYTHENKGIITQIVDKGRREIRATRRYVSQKHMGVLKVDDGHHHIVEPRLQSVSDNPAIDLHEEQAVRPRVINISGPLRDIFECQMMISTSGGVNVPERIVEFSDLGVNDLMFEMGAKNMRQFWRHIKRRDEAELAEQSHWALGKDKKEHKDGVSYTKRVRGGGEARSALTGGKVGGKEVPGLLNEPMSGAYRYRDMFFEAGTWLLPSDKKDVGHTRHIGPEMEKGMAEAKAHVQHLLDEANIALLDPVQLDKLVEIGFGIMKPLVDYMDARKYVENRGGKAPRTWAMDNELIFRDYVSLLLNRDWVKEGEKYHAGGVKENMGPMGLDYAVQGRSPMAIKLFEGILRTSSYHLLKQRNMIPLIEGGKDPDSGEILKGAKNVEAKMKLKRNEIQFRMESDLDFQALIARRREVLEDKDASEKAIEAEIFRMKTFYVEDRLHKEFFGEWPAMYATVGEAPEAPHPPAAAVGAH